MSKFFRSMSSGSSSSGESSGSGDEVAIGGPSPPKPTHAGPSPRTISRPEEPSQDDVPDNSLNADNGVNDIKDDISKALNGLRLPATTTDSGLHSQMLLHALLEERCMKEVLHEHSHGRGHNQRLDDATIQAEATARYQSICAAMAPHNLMSTGLEHNQYSITRQRYRDGLDLLSRAATLPTAQPQGMPFAPPRRLLTDSEFIAPKSASPWRFGISGLDDESPSAFHSPTPMQHALESRYLRDFEEIGVLGKGGYGVVYHVRNRLDSVDYAVKKVPISAAKVARIKSRGQQELDDLLREVRTLAKLDHPNIVRYYAGWVEWSHVGSLPQPSDLLSGHVASDWTDYQADTGLAAEDSKASLNRVITQSNSGSLGIVFESSSPSHQTSAPEPSVDRSDLSSMRSFDNRLDSSKRQPELALHLQMGLYPMTLVEFFAPQISDRSQENTVAPLKHCFHLQPSIAILLALLDGVEYLHHEGIVHRDLKPANIFLGASNGPRSARGSVDLFLCDLCREAGQAQPLTLKVCIGDFGLVTALAQSKAEMNASEAPVGTEIYRPTTAVPVTSPDLDVFALGLIAFELLWPFNTRMERYNTLNRVKLGEFPRGFRKRFGDKDGRVESCIRDMLSPQHIHTSIPDLKKRFLEIQNLSK